MTELLVGTKKGLFVLDGDVDVRGYTELVNVVLKPAAQVQTSSTYAATVIYQGDHASARFGGVRAWKGHDFGGRLQAQGTHAQQRAETDIKFYDGAGALTGTRDDRPDEAALHDRKRDPDRDQHQCRDRQPVVPEVPQRGIESRIQQHRRHEQRQRQFRLQRPRWSPGHKRQQHAADREKCWIGHLEPPRQRGKQHRAKQQPDDPFECQQFRDSRLPRSMSPSI